MKLLVLAHTPPPLHGQSAMVRLLVDALRQPGQGVEVYHVNLRLSETNADIGRWQPGKILAVLAACLRVWWVRLWHGSMTLYYVPAPGKRGALYRDWVIMALCRWLFPKLVLHWHAVGLGEWLRTHGSLVEQKLTRRWLGRSDLSIVLAPAYAGDIEMLHPKRVAVVANALTEHDHIFQPQQLYAPGAGRPFEILYIGLCSPEKGILDLAEAMVQLHALMPGAFRLTVAGAFDSQETEAAFQKRANRAGPDVHHAGIVSGDDKENLFSASHLLCFPTYYPHEGLPLVLIEAMAHDLPIVTTRWRAIAGMLPRENVWFVEPRRPDQIAQALLEARKAPAPNGAMKEHYLLNYTPAQHIAAMKKAFAMLEEPEPAPVAPPPPARPAKAATAAPMAPAAPAPQPAKPALIASPEPLFPKKEPIAPPKPTPIEPVAPATSGSAAGAAKPPPTPPPAPKPGGSSFHYRPGPR